ncbi:MAG TPA: low molecular weight protein-tyrosine-phosphatase [Streptosporangiaceae bacterium]|nr:low molecular weight protein-tyrosine-phosphatase [Streptosporangiaceae bacterium]
MTTPPPTGPARPARSAALPPPRDPAGPYRVCLVCLGNICRSPMAEAVLRAELDRAGLSGAVVVDSAGTGDWHIGSRMDPRARVELGRRGYDGASHVARQIQPDWLAERDLILAMDRQNLAALRRMATPGDRDRIRLLRSFDFASPQDAEVPDPYYGDGESFGPVLDFIEAAARGLAKAILADFT